MFQWLSPLSTLGSSARRCGGASEHQGVSFGPLRVCWSHCVKPCGPAAQFPLSALSSLSGAPLPSSGRVQRCCGSCASRSFKRPGRRPGALSTTHLKQTRSQVSEKQGQRHRRSRFQAAAVHETHRVGLSVDPGRQRQVQRCSANSCTWGFG